jgi:hypothetical protein
LDDCLDEAVCDISLGRFDNDEVRSAVACAVSYLYSTLIFISAQSDQLVPQIGSTTFGCNFTTVWTETFCDISLGRFDSDEFRSAM